jgi:hypothetical protein
MKMVMFTNKNGSLAFVYRHPEKHRLIRDEISSGDLSGFLELLQTNSLVDALDNTGERQQDWRGRSPSFWPEWRAAFQNSSANSDLIVQKLIDPEYAYALMGELAILADNAAKFWKRKSHSVESMTPRKND